MLIALNICLSVLNIALAIGNAEKKKVWLVMLNGFAAGFTASAAIATAVLGK